MTAVSSPLSLWAVPFLTAPGADRVELLSQAQQQELSRHASIRDLKARTVVYRAGDVARSVFIIGTGAVKSFRDLPSGRRRIAAFFFRRDLFGLAETGKYVNTVETMTSTQLHEIEVDTLTMLFQRDSALEFQFLCKAVHVLREAQHHNILMGRRDAAGRLVMLLSMLQRQDAAAHRQDISVPMTKSDMANYLGLSLEAVVRASRRLERQGIIQFAGRHSVHVVDRQRFQALAAKL